MDESQWPIVFDNEPSRFPRQGGYLQAVVRHGGAVQSTIGGEGKRLFERNGLLFCTLYTPAGANLHDTDVHAHVVRSAVEGKTLRGTDGTVVWTFACSVEEQGVAGEYFVTQIETPFRYETRK